MTFRKILCATDFSTESKQALGVAVRLAVRDDADLTIVHAWQLPYASYAGELVLTADIGEEAFAGERRALEDEGRRAVQLGATRTTTRFVAGVGWSAICNVVAADPTFDLVVAGTHGRTGLKRFLLGSVAQQLVRHAACSVLVVRGTDESSASFNHVLCPIDFSPQSKVASALATRVANRDGSRITLFHAIELSSHGSGEAQLAGIAAEFEKGAIAMLERAASDVRTTTELPVTTLSRVGLPSWQVPEAVAADPTIDLVVIGSRGRTGIERVLLGSVAERVVQHARCSVLVARDRS